MVLGTCLAVRVSRVTERSPCHLMRFSSQFWDGRAGLSPVAGSENGGSGGQGSCQRSGSLLPPLEAKCRFLLTQTTANYIEVSLSDTGT